MAEQNAPEENTSEAPAKNPLFGKIVICVFMGTVILTECLLAYFLIPDADEVARRAEARMTERIQQNINPEGLGNEEKTVEFDMGQYSITSRQTEWNSSLRIDFNLVGTVLEEEQGDLEKAYERNQHRIRDQVIFEIRNSNLNDLSDPGLALIKRRILEKSNQLMGKPILQSVVFSEFSFVEQ